MKTKNWVLTLVVAAMGLLLFFQNCAPGKPSESSSQAWMQGVQSVEPPQNASVVNGALMCAGDCLVTFTESPTLVFPNISCGGNLTITNNQIRCDNNLTLSN